MTEADMHKDFDNPPLGVNTVECPMHPEFKITEVPTPNPSSRVRHSFPEVLFENGQ